MYSVLFWGSDPDLENDDCWTGLDFDNQADAEKCFNDNNLPAFVINCTEYIELDGPDCYKKRKNPNFKPSKDDGEWEREIRMQAAMMGDY